MGLNAATVNSLVKETFPAADRQRVEQKLQHLERLSTEGLGVESFATAFVAGLADGFWS